MNRQLKRKHLVLAERHVAEGEEHLARQRNIIAELERTGGEATLSRSLLQRYEKLQALHLDDLHRLLEELLDEPPSIGLGRPHGA